MGETDGDIQIYRGTFWLKLPFARCQHSQLGAIRFDRDLRSITTYLASQTAFGDAREKFVRLQQISTLLNLDSVSDVPAFLVYLF